jgi:hypothetical protein
MQHGVPAVSLTCRAKWRLESREAIGDTALRTLGEHVYMLWGGTDKLSANVRTCENTFW